MSLIRSFFAIPVSKSTLAPLIPEIEKLKAAMGDLVVWKNPQDWHITLRFLGEVNHEQKRTLIEAAREIARETHPGKLHVKKLATFPLPTSPHLALHIVSSTKLKSLADKLEGAALAVGLNKDPRRFRPHITLGKFVKEAGPFQPLPFNHSEDSEEESFDIPFEELVLYASNKMQGDGSHYRALQAFRFHDRGE